MPEELEETRHSSDLPYPALQMPSNSVPCKSNILIVCQDNLQTTRKLHCLLVHNRHKSILRFRHLIVGMISTPSLQMSESYLPDPPM